MTALLSVAVAALLVAAVGFALSIHIVQQYEEGILFRQGRVVGVRKPGLHGIVPGVDVLRRVSMRIVTMPIPINKIAQTTLRKVVGQRTLDETLAESDRSTSTSAKFSMSPPRPGAFTFFVEHSRAVFAD